MTPQNEKRKIETGVIIALIGMAGTLCAALLSSPLFVRWVDSRATPQSPGNPGDPVLIFNHDFQNGSTSGFGFQSGEWNLVKSKSNTILRVQSGADSIAWATFGPTDFQDGIIDLKLKFEKLGAFHIIFRDQAGDHYAFVLNTQQAVLGRSPNPQDPGVIPLSESAVQLISTQTGIWYELRIEARGSRITAYIDGNRLFSADEGSLHQGGLQLMLEPGARAVLDDVQVWSFEP